MSTPVPPPKLTTTPTPPPQQTITTTMTIQTEKNEWEFILHTPPIIRTPSTSSDGSKRSGSIRTFPQGHQPPPKPEDYPWNNYFKGFLPIISVRDPVSFNWYYKFVDHQDPPPPTSTTNPKRHCPLCNCRVNPHYHHLRCGKKIASSSSSSKKKKVSWDPCCKKE